MFIPDNHNREVPENSQTGTVVGNPIRVTNVENGTPVWDILDPSPFRIDNASVTTVGEPIDYETTPSYTTTVTIREPGTPLTESNETRDVTIAIINVDEPGEVTFSSQNPARNTPFTAARTDPDGSVVIDRWTWTATDPGNGPWTPVSGHNGTGS